MHTHSKYSPDCNMDFKIMAKYGKKRGLDGMAITDHNSMDGVIQAKRIFEDYGLVLVPGVELRHKDCDFLIYFVEDERLLTFNNIHELIDFVHSNGGIIALAHPYRPGYLLPLSQILERIDAIEVFNSRSKEHENLKAKELKIKYGKGAVAGSDAHTYDYIGLGTVISEGNSLEDLRENILKDMVKIESHMPNKITRAKGLFTVIKHMSSEKRRYYITHPLDALNKLLRR